MQIAITGLSNSGKTTLFNALTGQKIETTVYPSVGGEPNIGVVKVPDKRIDKLTEMFKPKKTTFATVEYIDFMGITKDDLKQNKAVFERLKDASAVIHVVRCFDNDSVMHPLGDVDPIRDVRAVESELVFGDFELVEKRLESMELSIKKGKKPPEDEKKVLLKCKAALEKEIPLRELEWNADDLKAVRHLQFMSIKPTVIVLNIGEKDINSSNANEAEGQIKAIFEGKPNCAVLTVSASIEMDIAGMSAEDAAVFLDDLGIKEPALLKLIRHTYEILGLISFFTVGEDEVRAWTINRGTSAHNAAGKIHSDIEKGFIRAEVVAYEDFIRLGGMQEAKEKGLHRLEGKTYEVKDGDIINFRFNV